jgi:hypothetical protein
MDRRSDGQMYVDQLLSAHCKKLQFLSNPAATLSIPINFYKKLSLTTACEFSAIIAVTIRCA